MVENPINHEMPYSEKLSGLCTRCGATEATFVIEGGFPLPIAKADYVILGKGEPNIRPEQGEQVTLLKCDLCDGKIVVIEKYGRREWVRASPPEPVDERHAMITPEVQHTRTVWHGVQWYPPQK